MGSRRSFLFLFVGALAVFLVACNSAIITGSGDVVTESVEIPNFHSIALEGSGDVIITQGENESLTVETDENVIDQVKAEVINGVLHLGLKEDVTIINYTRLVFRVGVNDLSGLTISGSGDVESEDLAVDLLDATVNGSGDIRISGLSANGVETKIDGSGEVSLTGQTIDKDVTINGSGRFNGGNMRAQNVEVQISGSGDATVWAEEFLDVNISGSGSVGYYGQPSVIMSGSGSGEVNSLGDR